jgi:hypothetical protein
MDKERWEEFRAFLIERLKERSSWIALGFIITLCGVKFGAHVNWENATGIGMAIAAIIQFIWPDKK